MINILKKRSHTEKMFSAIDQPEGNRKTPKRFRSDVKVKYDKLFELCPEGIILMDLNGVVTAANPASYENGGYSKEDYIGKHFSDIITVSESDVAIGADILEILKRDGEIKPFEWSYKRKDGTTGYTEIYASLLKEDQQPVGILVIKKDITGRKYSERIAAEGEIKYRDLYEKASNAYFSIGVEGLIHQCNARAAEMLGYEKSELIGKPVLELYADTLHGKDKALRVFQRSTAGEETVDEELQMKKSNSALIWVSLTVNVTKDDDDEVLESRSMFVDITERKRAEEALKETENTYRDLLDNTNDLIQSVKPDGHFRYVNNAWRKTLGYDEEELSNITIFDVIHPDYLQHCQLIFQKLMSGESVNRVEAALISKSGDKIFVEGDVNVKFIDGKPVYTRGIFRDVTQNKKLEEHVYRLSNTISMSPDYLVITDFDAKIVDINEKTLKLYGVNKKEELQGKHFLELIDPAERKMVSEDVAEIIKKGSLERREYTMISKQGEKHPIQVSTSLVKDADGKPIGMIRIGRELD